ncbi:hypothetical protein H6P81_004482 [Aristolochia fimbriata]|uniref:Ribosomal protein eL8/eL30/eS12/Gadd45 domain-containing protein n=1 Tax=Aristolochia fimbriata TaxID=158543 RepID=A0AAV7FG24_ARIFI|nr:hypothetical protein H6P81_004482 [Aristolochia fimbriata]
MAKKKSRKVIEASKVGNAVNEEHSSRITYSGESLTILLKRLSGEIETAKLTSGPLPEKIRIKQQFSIGVNDVTRVLERMPLAERGNSDQEPPPHSGHKPSPVQLQAILLASDCNSRWLTKHLPSLASSRNVPLIFVKDNKGGSLRLGEVVKIKTAIALGIKTRGSGINKFIKEVLQTGNQANVMRDL